MCSYNALNDVPTSADPYLLQTILREHWSWTNEDQYITSDCDAIQNIYMPRNYTSTRERAVADGLIAGTDLNRGTYYQSHLPSAYNEGLFNESAIDQVPIRRYPALVELEYFDPASATLYRSLDFINISTLYAESLALKAAEEGIALLKNDGTLPLSVQRQEASQSH
jgi:beta-D-xylosidase 4